MGWIVSKASERNARRENQDATGLVETPYGMLYVLADGMGGASDGQWAADRVVDRWPAYLARAHDNGNTVDEAMLFAARGVNREIFRRAREKNMRMGTTVVAALETEEGFRILHLGDSRAYHYGREGLQCLTRDHTAVQVWLDEGKITRDEARNHPRRSLLTKAVGVSAEVEPDLTGAPLALQQGESLILCSDGLCGFATDETIAETLAETPDPTRMADALVDCAMAAGSDDNISVICISRPGALVRADVPADPATMTASPEPVAGRPRRDALLPLVAALFLGLVLGVYHLIPSAGGSLAVQAPPASPGRGLSEVDLCLDYPWQSEVCPSSLVEKATASVAWTAPEAETRKSLASHYETLMHDRFGDQIDTEDAWRGYLERLGRRLAPYATVNTPISFHHVDDPSARAFGLPGGEIYVFRGMLDHLDNEAQLAFVLARLIHHIDRCRLPELDEDMPNGAEGGGLIGLSNEKEADAFALAIMVSEGYSPYQAVALVRRWPEAINDRRVDEPIDHGTASRACALKNQTVSLTALSEVESYYVGVTNLVERITADEARF